MSTHNEQLALFGRDRYHDWVVFFITTIVLIVISIVCSIWLYIDTDNLVSEADVAGAPSQFEDFKGEVNFLSQYINERNAGTEVIVPADPSLR